jgi:hypothetical protein
MVETRNAYRIYVRQHLGKRPSETSRRRWEDDRKLDKGVAYDDGRWMELAEDGL